MTSLQLFDLSGKVAIVTGSTKGIGRAMAQGLAEAGASVVVSSRKQDLCEQVAGEIRAATGRDDPQGGQRQPSHRMIPGSALRHPDSQGSKVAPRFRSGPKTT